MEVRVKLIEVENGTAKIFFDYEVSLVSAVKQIATARFSRGPSRHWIVKLNATTVEQLESFASDYGFSTDSRLVAVFEEFRVSALESVAASHAKNAEIAISGLGGELRPFQRAGTAYALAKKRTFIADEMGLGKTVQALATLQAAQAFPALILCPASLKLNWKREAEKWIPGRTVSVLNGKNTDAMFGADILILNYDNLKKNLERLLGLGLRSVVADESHYLKNFKAQRTEAAKKICSKCEYRIFLTGTPLLNRPQELLSQLGAIGRLDDLGGFWPFAKRYCRAYQSKWGWDMSGAAHLDELNQKLRATCYVRRNKADVLTELPAKQRANQTVEISNRAEYQRAEKSLIAWLRESVANDAEFLRSIAGMSSAEQKAAKNARADEAEQKGKRAERLVKIEALKRLAARGKLEAAQEWIESFLETGEKLVVFAWHKEIVAAVADMFHCDSITGDTPLDKRQAYVDKFQNDPSAKIIVLNIQAGGVGLTLTAASNVLFLELGWNPGVHDQAEDRCHRIGQESQVTAWYLLAQQTIDDKIYDLIESKRAVVDAATEGGEAEKSGIVSGLVEQLIA